MVPLTSFELDDKGTVLLMWLRDGNQQSAAGLSGAARQAREALATVAADGLRAAAEPLLHTACLDVLSTSSSLSRCSGYDLTCRILLPIPT
jgi:hypothetical protein